VAAVNLLGLSERRKLRRRKKDKWKRAWGRVPGCSTIAMCCGNINNSREGGALLFKATGFDGGGE
jgi:hypothetical protein